LAPALKGAAKIMAMPESTASIAILDLVKPVFSEPAIAFPSSATRFYLAQGTITTVPGESRQRA
jgi:hypothetical protein